MKTTKSGHGSKVPIYRPSFTGNESKYINECIASGWVSSAGLFVDSFEKEFADYIGTKYASTSSNGTTALHLAVQSLGIKSGEVIVPDLTFAATANAVIHAGLKPVSADIDPETLNISAQSIRENITEKTKAIIPVHLYGRPAPIKEIMELAEEKNLYVIEDAAESHGAEIHGKKAGSFGDASIFSFYGNKIMTTGEGGMVVSDNQEIMDKVNILKNHGMNKSRKYWHDIVGYNYRMTNLQAALGLAQLEQIEEKIAAKRKIAQKYSSLLKDSFVTPSEEKGTRNVYWLYWIQANNPDLLAENLEKKGIESRRFFYPLSSMPPFKAHVLKNADNAFRKGLCLPSYPGLSDSEIEEICSVLLQ